MKKLLAFLLVSLFCISLYGCGIDDVDKDLAFKNMRSYLINDFTSADYYIQMTQTKSDAHVMTEISGTDVVFDGDCAFLEYDYSSGLKFYRNGKLTTVSPQTYYTAEVRDAKWTDFQYYKSAEKYFKVLFQLCQNDMSDKVKEIKIENNDNKNFPYKISVYFDLDKINTKELFNNGGNFSSLSIKFLCQEDLNNFDNISLNIQYDYNSEFYAIGAYFGEQDPPDKDGKNGHRPEDIQKVFEEYSAEMESSFEEYLNSVQSGYNQNFSQ